MSSGFIAVVFIVVLIWYSFHQRQKESETYHRNQRVDDLCRLQNISPGRQKTLRAAQAEFTFPISEILTPEQLDHYKTKSVDYELNPDDLIEIIALIRKGMHS